LNKGPQKTFDLGQLYFRFQESEESRHGNNRKRT
jgi:hypothetical protein